MTRVITETRLRKIVREELIREQLRLRDELRYELLKEGIDPTQIIKMAANAAPDLAKYLNPSSIETSTSMMASSEPGMASIGFLTFILFMIVNKVSQWVDSLISLAVPVSILIFTIWAARKISTKAKEKLEGPLAKIRAFLGRPEVKEKLLDAAGEGAKTVLAVKGGPLGFAAGVGVAEYLKSLKSEGKDVKNATEEMSRFEVYLLVEEGIKDEKKRKKMVKDYQNAIKELQGDVAEATTTIEELPAKPPSVPEEKSAKSSSVPEELPDIADLKGNNSKSRVPEELPNIPDLAPRRRQSK